MNAFSKNTLRFVASLLASILIICMGLSLVPAQLAYADNQKGTVINVTTSVNIRKRPSTSSEIIKSITLGTKLTIEQSVPADADDKSGYTTWYKITCSYQGHDYSGYIANYFVSVDTASTPTTTPTPTPTTTPSVTPTAVPAPTTVATPDFEKQISAFPESYKPFLRDLHAKHPSWIFVAENCSKTWDEVLSLETRSGVSLVEDTCDDAWKSKASEHYDPATGKYKVIDSPNWVNASRSIVAYYLDPRNNLSENAIFQFLNLSYDKSAIPDKPDYYVSKVIDGTFLTKTKGVYAGAEMDYNQLIAIGGYESSINPIFLSARIVQEVGVNGSTSSNGATGYYNFYNIGAYSDATNSSYVGLRFAQYGNGVPNSDFNKKYMIPWNTQGASIVGGAKWISDNYVTKGQNTIYYMRFNVSPNSAQRVGYHQYMTATTSPSAEATRMYNAYNKSGLINAPLTFIIPVYKDMPAEKAPLPTSSNAATDYVSRTYSILLGRTPTGDELSRLSTAMITGETVDAIATVITSQEFKDKNYTFQQQVELLYKLLLDRDPDAVGLNYYVGLMNDGYSIGYVFAIMANSTEAQTFINKYSLYPGSYQSTDVVDNNMALKPFVASLYSGFMGRSYDVPGLRSWINSLATKNKTGQQVVEGFYKSTEFQNMSLTNEEFVRRLYIVCLGRDVDPDGLNYWLNEMNVNHRSRDYVFAGFVNSQEFNSICAKYGISISTYTPTTTYQFVYDSAKGDQFVTRLYQLALGRDPDAGGFEYWTGQLKSGVSGKSVAYGFIFSKELEEKNLSNDEFLNRMYQIFLNRDPDPSGKAYWLDRMENGSSRFDIFKGFVYSTEFEGLCFDAGIIPNEKYG